MNELIITKSIGFFLFFWSIGLIFLWIRPRIEIFWKIISTLIYLLYLWFFWDDVVSGFDLFQAKWYAVSLNFLKELIVLLFMNLFLLWPILLIFVFYKANDLGAENLLKFFAIFTIVIWVIFIIYVYFSSDVDTFLLDSFRKMLPGEK